MAATTHTSIVGGVVTARFKAVTLTLNLSSDNILYSGEEMTCVKKLQNRMNLLVSSRFEYVVVDTRGHIITGKPRDIIKRRVISGNEHKRISGSITEASIQGLRDYVEATFRDYAVAEQFRTVYGSESDIIYRSEINFH